MSDIVDELTAQIQGAAEQLEELMFNQLAGPIYARVLGLMLQRLHQPHVEAVSAERDALRTRVAELEAERDEAVAIARRAVELLDADGTELEAWLGRARALLAGQATAYCTACGSILCPAESANGTLCLGCADVSISARALLAGEG